MRPFLLIQTRADDDVVADELRSTTALGGFRPGELDQLRLDREFSRDPEVHEENLTRSPLADPAPAGTAMAPRHLDWEEILDRHAGVILCGSPFNSSDPEEQKSALQLRVEVELRRMLDAVVARDHPFFGACYGVGTLGLHQGGTVDRAYGEQAGPVEVTVTEDGRQDPLLAGVDPRFQAFVGHKEAVSRLPEGAVLLATGEACPVQMFRVGAHMYATQFHPELDQQGLLFRLEKYRDHGYFDPADEEATFGPVRASRVTEPQKILQNFRTRYSADA